MALYLGQEFVIEQLIEHDPRLPSDNLGLQIAMYDYSAVKKAVKKDLEAAVRKIGVRSPILHLSFSKYIHIAPNLRDEMIKIAELLVASGADVNDSFAPEPENTHRLSVLYGALGHANNMILSEWLLERGANPDDNESLYHSTELGHQEGLKLLIRYGVSTRGTNALLRAIDFCSLKSVRLLLDHGADPNEVTHDHPSGQPIDVIPALHQAARRWCPSEIAKMLVENGAHPNIEWKGHTPYAIARAYGNTEISEFLENKGFGNDLSDLERKFAECAEGRKPSERINPAALDDEFKKILTRIVLNPDRLEHLKNLIELGLDPNQCDEMGLTPLHLAGWAGLPKQVEYLMRFDPDLTYRNKYGGDALGTIVHGSEHRLDAQDRDHISCARLVLEAGAKLSDDEIETTGCQKMAEFLSMWRNKFG